jgi:TldD protein
MEDLVHTVVERASAHCDYADARFVSTLTETISTRNGAVDEVDRADVEGLGVRVRIGGAWGFAGTRGTDSAAADAALERALAIARAQPAAPPTDLVPVAPARGSHEGPAGATDPFSVSLEDKIEVLLSADEGMAAAGAAVRVRTGHFHGLRETRVFASTEGALCTQTFTECGGGIAALAVGDGESQQRSYPSDHGGDVAQAGWEHFAGLDLPGHAPRVGEEAVALLSAPACPAGETTLILGSEQLSIQLHESVGHAVELDRVLGGEASYAGTSWVTPQDLGSLRYGSELMNVTADATVPGGLGSYAWDDEGAPAAATPIVAGGVLQGFLTSRETAALIGAGRSGACLRASGFDRQPIVRMTNVSIAPGDAGSLDDLIADTDEGVLMETNRSWSIDQRRWQFQFATQVAWEIRGGKRGRLLRNPSYAGVTPEFWASLDAICSPSEWRLHGLMNCGKGEPGQLMHVSHGAAPARFRGVSVGVA